MMYSSRTVLIVVLSLALSACASSEHSQSEEASGDHASNRIVISNLSVSVSGMSAFDVVNQYKPLWLQNPGKKSLQNTPEVQVYVNNPGEALGSISALRSIRATEVESIEYFNERDAQFRFGLGNSAGAILVHTKDGS